ncbi:CHAD domain-containing protein [Sediminicurvatus halobius]|uniref:CHAD domain-containing protein n=1 Tax=Sediminicurvatus halobius TaxID=2182432 RepID=UPI001304F948|nr:CHAD domain-containing protein [Spiribacter halobius]UEX77815.1 CHAD domain-containing protein [Spiribacter halobius]
MAFRFQRSESVPGGVRRLVRERIDDARRRLQATGEARHEGIHEARKRIKEIRALLRLVRFALGDRFAVENRWYRDTARGLSAARDAQAVVESWDKLVAARGQELDAGLAQDTRERLLARRDDAAGVTDTAPVTATLEGLLAARERIARWPLNGGGFAALSPGLERSYRQGRREMRLALAGGGVAAHHEWRKRVKDLWYHTRLLEPVWPALMVPRRQALKALSDTLGDDHDLAVLDALLAAEPVLVGGGDGEAVHAAIARQQSRLQAEAARLGTLLYAEKPGAYTRRLGVYWQVWRGEAAA